MINIMFCGNQKVYDGLLIAIISIVKHTKEPLSIYLITANLQKLNDDFVPLGEGERKRIEMIVKNANSNSSVKLIDISEMFEKEMLNGTNMTTRYTPYIFLRLFADEITELPDKILYLDADLVIYDDIKKLYKYNYDIRKLLYQYYAIREIKRHINRLNEIQPLQENIDNVIEHFIEYIGSFERGLTYSKKGWVRLMNILYEIYPKKMEEYL